MERLLRLPIVPSRMDNTAQSFILDFPEHSWLNVNSTIAAKFT